RKSAAERTLTFRAGPLSASLARPSPSEGGWADVGVQPRVEWLRGPEEADDAVLGRLGPEPGPDRPLLPRDEALVAQQLDAGVVAVVALGRGLQHLVPAGLDARGRGFGHDALELGAGAAVRHRPPVAVELVGRHHPHAAARGQAVGRQLHVAAGREAGAD